MRLKAAGEHEGVKVLLLPFAPFGPVYWTHAVGGCDRELKCRRLGERRHASPAGLPGAYTLEGAVMARSAALPIVTAEGGLTRYLEEIRRFPMLEPQEEYMLAKRWKEHGDRDAAHRLVTSHLRLVAKIAMGYRGYGLPISEVIIALRDDLGGQCRPDAGGQALRAREGLPPRHLRDVVDQGVDPGIHPALVVARENGHDREPEEAVLQPAQGEEQDLRARRRRHAPRSGEDHRQAPRRAGAGRDRDEPPARRR